MQASGKKIIIFGPMENSMFDTLLSLPLFQGMTKADFDSLLQKVKFDFARFEDGETVISSNGTCSHFAFLLGGTVESSRSDEHGRFEFHELISTPCLIEPYSMFGRHNLYRRSYRAVGRANFLFIDKQYVYTEIGKYNICRMNMLNILSGRVQKLDSDVWSIDEMELRERIIRFIRSLADHHKGEKKLYIKMNDMAVLLDATRINVSRELNALQDQGLIELSRGGIRIPLLENLK